MGILKAIGLIILILVLLIALLFTVIVLFLNFSPVVGKNRKKEEMDRLCQNLPHYHDGAFHNSQKLTVMTGEKPYSSDRKKPSTMIRACKPDFKNGCSKEGLRFTWLGHSSSVIQIGGKTVLIDPVLSQRCSPVRFAGPKRFSQLPLKAEDLPAADAVFLSHDHYDHLDYHLIKTIKNKTGMFVVPLGLDAVLLNWGIPQEKITALDWWQSAEINGLSFTLTPSQHFTGRNPLRRNAVLWGGLYLKDENHSVYFTGDGGYNNVFTEVRGRLGSPELMIAECGQYDPAWASMHMFPEQTVQAALDVNASLVIPVHWGSYCICNHAWDDSITRFVLAAKKAGISISVPQIGQSADYEQLKGLKERWWQRYG